MVLGRHSEKYPHAAHILHIQRTVYWLACLRRIGAAGRELVLLVSCQFWYLAYVLNLLLNLQMNRNELKTKSTPEEQKTTTSCSGRNVIKDK